MPFLAEKVSTILYNLIKRGDDDEGEELPEGPIVGTNRQGVVRSKVRTIARLNKMFATLREEQELLLKIKNISPDGKIPRGLLMDGRPAIKNGNFTYFSSQTVLPCTRTRQIIREET